MNVFLFRIWGNLADRWNNRSALIVAGQLFFFSVLLWPFTTMPEKHDYTLAILILIHVLVGISTAGVNLCVGNLGLKSAPKGKATAFLAANAVVAGIAATLGPLTGGWLGDLFEHSELKFTLTYSKLTEGEAIDVPALNFRGLDFVFLLSAIVGSFAVHRLAYVEESARSTDRLGLDTLFHETRKAMAHVSNVAGIRRLTHFPYELLVKKFTIRRKNGNNHNSEKTAPPDGNQAWKPVVSAARTWAFIQNLARRAPGIDRADHRPAIPILKREGPRVQRIVGRLAPFRREPADQIHPSRSTSPKRPVSPPRELCLDEERILVLNGDPGPQEDLPVFWAN